MRLKHLTIISIASIIRCIARRHQAGEKRIIHNASTLSFVWLNPADLQFCIEKLHPQEKQNVFKQKNTK